MARVVAFIPDLLFGSNVLGSLSAAGHEVQLVSGLGDADQLETADVLVVDLTVDAAARLAAIPSERPPTLGFYAHIEQDVRALAEEAGLDMVVPRSRMAREGDQLVGRLAGA
jgi:hypothetical protein